MRKTNLLSREQENGEKNQGREDAGGEKTGRETAGRQGHGQEQGGRQAHHENVADQWLFFSWNRPSKANMEEMMKRKYLSFLKLVGACLFVFALSFGAGTRVLLASPTFLHLDFQDGRGGTVALDHATLVLVTGNYVDKLPLALSAKGLDIPLDASWIRANWPGGQSRLKNMDRAYIYLKAAGYAPIVSEPIHWMGTESDGAEKNVVITFPRGKTMDISKGDAFSMVVNFRKPTDRFVRLSDGKGNPLAGVEVKSYVYWSRTDKGVLNGADLLGVGTSDADGKVPVIDGDFTYALQVTHKSYPGNPAGTVLIVKKFEEKGVVAPVAVPTDAPTVIDLQ
jgi:hypothetical protein